MVLPERIELSASPLPMECSTTELRQLYDCLGVLSARSTYAAGTVRLARAMLADSDLSKPVTRKNGNL
jgi:hypothetical protein